MCRRRAVLLVGALGLAWAGLFDADVHVVSLDPSSLSEHVVEGKAKWMVMFYLPWCGHCQHYAPTWSRLAASLAGSELRIGAVDCVAYRSACTAHKAKSFPTLRSWRIADPEPDRLGAAEVKGRDDPLAWVAQHVRLADLNIHGHPTGLVPPVAKHSEPSARPAGALSRLHDASLAIGVGLSAAGQSVPDHEGVAALKRWVRVLARGFPAHRQPLARLEQALAAPGAQPGRVLANWKMSTEVNWQVSRLGMTSAAARAAGVKSPWQACGPVAERGYPCALWTLMHLLLAHTHCPARSPAETIRAIRGFVGNFFECEECRLHFLNESAAGVVDPQYECSAKQPRSAAMLWLWRLHNSVNLRLHKGVWPPIRMCTACRLSTTATFHSLNPKYSLGGSQREEVKWDENAVMRFLEVAYCDEKIDPSACKPPSAPAVPMFGQLSKVGFIFGLLILVGFGSYYLMRRTPLDLFYPTDLGKLE